MREILRSDRLPGPRFNYSPCVKIGPIYQFAGMIALSRETGALVAGGPREETAHILTNLIAALPDFGLSLEHMFSARIYTTDFDRFAEINGAWNEVFENVDPPARTSVGVSQLPLGATVEMEFAFYKV